MTRIEFRRSCVTIQQPGGLQNDQENVCQATIEALGIAEAGHAPQLLKMPSVADHTYLRRKEHVIAQENSGALVLFNMDDGQYYSLNEIGNRIWELCDGSRSVGQVVSILCEEYDSPAEIVNSDALELLEELVIADLLTEEPQPGADPGS